MLFVQVILPVFLIIFAGFLLERKFHLDFQSLTYCSLYLCTPALVLSSLMKRPLQLALLGQLGSFMLLYTLILLAVALFCARVLHMDDEERSALTMTTTMMNVGNFGLPLAYFAFGDAGVAISIMVFILFNIPLGTLGIVLAQGSRSSLPEALKNMARIPIFHAVVLAFALKALHLQLPDFLLRPVDLLGQGAIPLMLLLLGMQLARTSLRIQGSFLGLATGLRLFIAPLVALGIAALLGIHGLPRKVVVLQTSTPAAILPLLYSLRFGTRPDLVAGVIFASTLASAFSLTLLLYLLR